MHISPSSTISAQAPRAERRRLLDIGSDWGGLLASRRTLAPVTVFESDFENIRGSFFNVANLPAAAGLFLNHAPARPQAARHLPALA